MMSGRAFRGAAMRIFRRKILLQASLYLLHLTGFRHSVRCSVPVGRLSLNQRAGGGRLNDQSFFLGNSLGEDRGRHVAGLGNRRGNGSRGHYRWCGRSLHFHLFLLFLPFGETQFFFNLQLEVVAGPRNSNTSLPICLPISGSRLGPKTTNATTNRKSVSGMLSEARATVGAPSGEREGCAIISYAGAATAIMTSRSIAHP